MGNRINVIVYSDYLCPWCYIAAVRLQRIKGEYGERVDITWKSFPLVHEGMPRLLGPDVRDHMRRSWLRAGEEERSISYNLWPDSSPLPTSSLPAQDAAKCAQLQGKEAFERFHMLVLRAFFGQNRDISDRDVLISLAVEAHLDKERFTSDFDGGSQRDEVLADYREAVDDTRFSGVPTAIFDHIVVLEGAVPIEIYRRAVDVILKRGLMGASRYE